MPFELRESDTAHSGGHSCLKRFAISLLKQVDDQASMAMRRWIAGGTTTLLAKVPGIPAT